MRLKILDFLEQFRMAYNTKNNEFLEKVYSDDALILVGTVLKKKKMATLLRTPNFRKPN
jgi:hypothetical protein